MDKKMKVYTMKEASSLIEGISEFRIKKMIENKEMHALKAGGKYLVSEGELIKAVFGEESAEYLLYREKICGMISENN